MEVHLLLDHSYLFYWSKLPVELHHITFYDLHANSYLMNSCEGISIYLLKENRVKRAYKYISIYWIYILYSATSTLLYANSKATKWLCKFIFSFCPLQVLFINQYPFFYYQSNKKKGKIINIPPISNLVSPDVYHLKWKDW